MKLKNLLNDQKYFKKVDFNVKRIEKGIETIVNETDPVVWIEKQVKPLLDYYSGYNMFVKISKITQVSQYNFKFSGEIKVVNEDDEEKTLKMSGTGSANFKKDDYQILTLKIGSKTVDYTKGKTEDNIGYHI
jgi:hypothetical protein